MNKYILILLTSFIWVHALTGQAIFEKTYYNYDVGGPTVYDIEDHGAYYVFQKSGGTIDFYSKNHSFYKTIQLSQVGNSSYAVVNISSQLINADNQIEVIYYVINPPDYTTYIQDENGGLIQSMEGISWVTWIEGDYKLAVSSIEQSGRKDIYDLPGSIYTGVNGRLADNITVAYPNPSANFVHLPYTLKTARKGEMMIYNMNGQLIEQLNISDDFVDIKLDICNYPNGIYIYAVGDGSSKPLTAKFVVQ